MEKMSVLSFAFLMMTTMSTALAATAASSEARFSLNAVHVEKSLITSADVQEVGVVAQAGADGLAIVRMTLTPESASRLAAYSKKNVGKELAVMVNHHLVAAPVIRVPITGRQFEVSGLTAEQAKDLVNEIQSSAK